MTTKPESDHRKRAAAARRARMQERLIESAVLVFAEKGLDASVIDDVIEIAGVSRGTFYNYFHSNRELLIATSDQLGNELIHIIERNVMDIPDPAELLATGVRLFIETARQFPLLGKFMSKAGLDSVGPGHLIYEYLPVHISKGMEQGRFVEMPMVVALDLIRGAALMSVSRAERDECYPEETVASMLRGFGLAPEVANQLVRKPLPDLNILENSLLERSAVRAANAMAA